MQNEKKRNGGKLKSQGKVQTNKQAVLVSNLVSKTLYGFYIKTYDHFSSFVLGLESFSVVVLYFNLFL